MEKKIIKLNLKKLYGGSYKEVSELAGQLINQNANQRNKEFIGEITKLIEAVKKNETTLGNMNFTNNEPNQEGLAEKTSTVYTDFVENLLKKQRMNSKFYEENNDDLLGKITSLESEKITLNEQHEQLKGKLKELTDNPELLTSERIQGLITEKQQLTENIKKLTQEKTQLTKDMDKLRKGTGQSINKPTDDKPTDDKPTDDKPTNTPSDGTDDEAIKHFTQQVESFKKIKSEKEAVMILWVSEGFSCNELIELLNNKNPKIKEQSKYSFIPMDIRGTCVPDSNITIDGEKHCETIGDIIKKMINNHEDLFKSGTSETDSSVHFFTGGLRRGVQTAACLSKQIKDDSTPVEINISKFLNEGRMRSSWFRSYGHTPPYKSFFPYIQEEKDENGDTTAKPKKKPIYTQIWEKLYFDKDNSINWDKYYALINKENGEVSWLEYFFKEDTYIGDYEKIIKYEEDFIVYYWFRYYTPFMPNIVTKKNFFMNHITDMFKSIYLSIVPEPVIATIVEGEGDEGHVPVATVIDQKGGRKLRTIRLRDYSDDPDFKYNKKYSDRNPRIIKLRDYSDDPYVIYENFKQEGGFFGDCISLATNLASNPGAELNEYIGKESFDDTDKKKLTKILKCIKNNPTIVKTFLITYLTTLETTHSTYKNEILLIKDIINKNFNYDSIIDIIKKKGEESGAIKYLELLLKLFKKEPLTEEDFKIFIGTQITDIPEDMPTTVDDLIQFFKDQDINFPIPQKVVDIAEIFYDVIKPKENTLHVPFSTPKIPDDVKKAFKEFFVPSEPFGNFNGKIVIMIGHKGLMKYVTKVGSTINNLTIVSQIVTNEEYYLHYENGQVIHPGFDNSKYLAAHENIKDYSDVKNRCEINELQSKSSKQVCENIIHMEINDGKEFSLPSGDIIDPNYDDKLFEFMFNKPEEISVFSSDNYKYVFFGKENIQKYNNHVKKDEFEPDYNFYYIKGNVTEINLPGIIPMYLKVYQKDSENSYFYISSNSNTVKTNFNGPFKTSRNNYNIDNLQIIDITDFREEDKNHYFKNVITSTSTNKKDIIITLKSMEDILSKQSLEVEEKKIPFNQSENFSEPLSVPEKWILISKNKSQKDELIDFLNQENYDNFKENILDKELNKEEDIILLYKIKV